MKPELSPSAAPERVADEYRSTLRAEPHGLHEVRRQVRDRLRAWGLEELTPPAAMSVSELLSNVHKHVTSPECELIIRRITGGIRVSVLDRDERLPVVREPDHLSESGRGLFLLGETVDLWGAERTPDGKEVWFILYDETPGADDDRRTSAGAGA